MQCLPLISNCTPTVCPQNSAVKTPQWGDRLWLWIVRKAPTLELKLELWKQRNRNGSSIHEKGKPKRERHIPVVILRGSSYIFLLLAKCNLYYKRLPPSEALGTSIWQQCRHCWADSTITAFSRYSLLKQSHQNSAQTSWETQAEGCWVDPEAFREVKGQSFTS